MGDEFIYKIGLITYYQHELTWAQDLELLELIQKVANKALGAGDDITVAAIQQGLINSGMVDIFMGMILKPKINAVYVLSFKWIRYLILGKISVGPATNSTIKKIFEDFFLLNKPVVNKLKEWLNSLDLIATAAGKMKPPAEK